MHGVICVVIITLDSISTVIRVVIITLDSISSCRLEERVHNCNVSFSHSDDEEHGTHIQLKEVGYKG